MYYNTIPNKLFSTKLFNIFYEVWRQIMSFSRDGVSLHDIFSLRKWIRNQSESISWSARSVHLLLHTYKFSN
jgi:hypothetical protein